MEFGTKTPQNIQLAYWIIVERFMFCEVLKVVSNIVFLVSVHPAADSGSGPVDGFPGQPAGHDVGDDGDPQERWGPLDKSLTSRPSC